MKRQNNARFSVSTWSLHRTLGRPAAYGPGDHRPPVVVADGRRGQIALFRIACTRGRIRYSYDGDLPFSSAEL